MLYFWLFVAVLLFLVVSYMGLTQGFKKWAFYYVFALIAFFAFISRRFMMRRMAKMQKDMEEKAKQQ